MGCAHKENQNGFTLVEIAIVMIIIGLLIGGTFGGMKLIESAQVQRIGSDFKRIESAMLTFKDTFGRFPGDLRNPSVRLPSCTDAPCATGGDGSRRVGDTEAWEAVLVASSEKYTIWHHLTAANLIDGVANSTDMNFGVGSPETGADLGIRIAWWSGGWWQCITSCWRPASHMLMLQSQPTAQLWNGFTDFAVDLPIAMTLDLKFDDGAPNTGRWRHHGCSIGAVGTDPWLITAPACQSTYSLGF